MQYEFLSKSSWLEDTPVSGMRYLPQFLDHHTARLLLQKLLAEVNWCQEQLFLYGKMRNTPRLTAWCGDPGVCYAYSGNQHVCDGWIPDLIPLRRRLRRLLGVRFNFALLNYYRDGSDSMAWHSDDEPSLGELPCIASLSLGATRRFRVRDRRKSSTRGPAVKSRNSWGIDLEQGSLLVMQNDSQVHYQHAVPKCRTATGRRLNVTFRAILPSEFHCGTSIRA